MTLIKPDGDDGTAHEILRAAAEQFERAILDFRATADRATRDQAEPITEAVKMAQHLRDAARVYFIEKQKLENSIRKDAGIIHDFAIDFRAARTEIRRRMARLRDAADPAEVSE